MITKEPKITFDTSELSVYEFENWLNDFEQDIRDEYYGAKAEAEEIKNSINDDEKNMEIEEKENLTPCQHKLIKLKELPKWKPPKKINTETGLNKSMIKIDFEKENGKTKKK